MQFSSYRVRGVLKSEHTTRLLLEKRTAQKQMAIKRRLISILVVMKFVPHLQIPHLTILKSHEHIITNPQITLAVNEVLPLCPRSFSILSY